MSVFKIIEKLNRLKELDKDFEIFGADHHKYTVNPALSEKEVASFEKQNHTRLPEEYREYLLQIGNGGAGPFYGLMALEDNDKNKTDSAKSFPFTKDNPVFLMELYGQWNDRYGDGDLDITAGVYEDAHCGIIYLAHEGCGIYSVLVVNGTERGNVWYFDFANDAGVFPLTNPKTGGSLTFFDWYNLWLDAALAHMESGSEELSGYANCVSQELAARFNNAIEKTESAKEPVAPMPSPMNAAQFWKYIDYARAAAGGWQNMLPKLVEALSALDAPDIFLWQQILDEYRTLADKQKLWAAAYIIMGGCGDDSFDYFRAWLIAQGKDVYLNALHDPDSLDEVDCGINTEFEALLSVAFEAWKSKRGVDDIGLFYDELAKYPMPKEMADGILSGIHYADDIDAEWDEEDDETLQALLPKLYASYWDDFAEDPVHTEIRAHFGAAQSFTVSGDYAAAVRESEMALELIRGISVGEAPNDEANPLETLYFEAYYRLAINHMNFDRYEKAVGWFDKALSIYPVWRSESGYERDTFRDMRLHYWRGWSWSKIYPKDHDGALPDFQASLSADETFRGDIYCSLGTNHSAAQRYNEAAVSYKNAMDEYAKDKTNTFSMYTPEEAAYGLGVALLGAKDYKGSALSLMEAIGLNGEYWRAYGMAQHAIACLGDYKLAEELKRIAENKSCPDPDKVLLKLYKFLGVKPPKRTEGNMGQNTKKQGFFQRVFGKNLPEKQQP